MASINNVRLPFARDQHGRVVSIHEVANGLACNCFCPGCGAKLIAKQGRASAWHFAHHHVEPCANGYESALHLAAKQIIADAASLMLPPCRIVRYPKGTSAPAFTVEDYWYVPGRPSRGFFDMWREAYAGFASTEATSVRFDRIELESALGEIRPDLIGYCGDRRLLIEVAVTHKVDDIKLAKIRALGLPAIEITLPRTDDVLDWTKLSELILGETAYKHWLYHPKLERMVDARLAAAAGEKIKADQKAKEREDRYRTNFAPSHELRFYLKNQHSQSKVYLRLCPSHVSIGLWPEHHDAVIASVKAALATFPSVRHDRRRQQWTLPAELSCFIELAKAMRHEGFFPDRVKIPPADKQAIYAALGFGLS